MELPKPKDIIFSRDMGTDVLSLNSRQVTLIFKEIQLNFRDFSHVITAQSTGLQAEMVGYVGFQTGHFSPLAAVDMSLLELKMLKVDPQHFQHGIGTRLIGFSRILAREKNKQLILQPERPGEFIKEEVRKIEWPMMTEQLREMYKRRGFRELSPVEQDHYTELLMNDRLTADLWFAGINPDTLEFSENKRYSMSLAEKASLANVPFETKVALNKLLLAASNLTAYDHNMRLYRRIVGNYLIEMI